MPINLPVLPKISKCHHVHTQAAGKLHSLPIIIQVTKAQQPTLQALARGLTTPILGKN